MGVRARICVAPILVGVAALVLIGQSGVASARDEGTGPNLDSFLIKHASKITLNAPPAAESSGKVTSSKDVCSGQAQCSSLSDCVRGRMVRVKNATTGVILAETKTKADGSYSVSSTFKGMAYAKVRRETIVADADHDGDGLIICKRARSPVVTLGSALPPQPKTDLALTKTAMTPFANTPGDVTYTIKVANNGPSDAQNVVVTDTHTPASSGDGAFAPSPKSDSRCSATGNTVVCNLGTVAVGTTVSLTVVFTYTTTQCGTTDSDSATVSSSTPETDASNDTGSAMTVLTGINC